MTATLTPPIKWPGGKQYLAKEIIARMPRHRHYVEPFAGGLAVLLNRDPNDKSLWLSEKAGQNGVSELVNDLNEDLTRFWRVLRNAEAFTEFKRLCEATELGRQVFDSTHHKHFGSRTHSDVQLAWAFFVRARQSRAGNFKSFTSITRSRTRRGINGNVSEWLGAVDGLPAVHARLRPVVIENMPAVKLIHREDSDGTLMYLDPPYSHDTRTTKDHYQCEMSEMQHRELLATITDRSRKSKFMLSGYRNDLYDQFLNGWTRHEFDKANHVAGGKTKRRMIECLWMNY